MLNSWPVLGAWAVLVAASLAVLLRDLARHNPQTMRLMRMVWLLTVLYSGPVGLAVYWFSGRRQIPVDSTWRRGWRSTAHCYSGCGAGEMLGLLLATAVLGWGTGATAALTFTLAYLFGFGLTVGPLLEEGVGLRPALWDAFTSESASIVAMEAVAISVDLWLAGDAGPGVPLFWSSVVISLSCGLLAAWPVNVLLIRFGVKSGMHDPRESHDHG